MAITIMAMLAGVIPSAALAVAQGEPLHPGGTAMVAVAGLSIGTLIRVAIRAGNLRARSVTLNLLAQAAPALAVT